MYGYAFPEEDYQSVIPLPDQSFTLSVIARLAIDLIHTAIVRQYQYNNQTASAILHFCGTVNTSNAPSLESNQSAPRLSPDRHAVTRPACCHQAGMLSPGRHAVTRPACCHQTGMLSPGRHAVTMQAGMLSPGRHAVTRPACCHQNNIMATFWGIHTMCQRLIAELLHTDNKNYVCEAFQVDTFETCIQMAS